MSKLKDKNETYNNLIKYFKSTINEDDLIRTTMEIKDKSIERVRHGKGIMADYYAFCFARGYAVGSAMMAGVLQDPYVLIPAGMATGAAVALYIKHKNNVQKKYLDEQIGYARYLQNVSEIQNDYEFPFDSGNKDDYDYIVDYLNNPVTFHNGMIVLDDDNCQVNDVIGDDFLIGE